MATYVPVYSDVFSLLSAGVLQSLANDRTKKAVSIDNQITRATDMRMFLKVALASSPLAGGSIDLFMTSGVDTFNYTDGYAHGSLPTENFSNPIDSTPIVSIPCLAGRTTYTWEGSLLDYVPSLPRAFAILLWNRSGVAFHASSQSFLTGAYVNYEYA